MLASTSLRSFFVLLVALAPVACAAPSADGSDGSDDGETEGAAESSDELRSAVSCQERTDTAYENGQPFPIQVIHVGGKPTTKATGHAFLKMQSAAQQAGVRLTLTSGFRTEAEQKHLYYCYTSGSCNDGNIAAQPGYSNHQSGLALDLSTSSWLARNAPRFGFVRTVPQEAWHYEYRGKDPGGPCSRGAAAAAAPGDTAGDPGDSSGAGAAPGGLTWVAPSQNRTMRNGFVVRTHANKAEIVKVVYSQGTFDFGTSSNPSDDFSLTYRFQYTGDKTLTARGYDASGTLLAQDYVDFTLAP